jgi:hypothetical protein
MPERIALTTWRKLVLSSWVLAMCLVMVLALLPVEHLQLSVFAWWDKAQHALASCQCPRGGGGVGDEVAG